MVFHVRWRQGDSVSNPDEQTINAVLAELDEPLDPEHPDVALTHESEWCLSAYPSGLIVWENLEDDEVPVRHMRNVSKQDVRRLWAELAQGKLQVVDAEDWTLGYG